MGHKLHEYEWDAELDMGDVFDDIKEDNVSIHAVCAASDCMYEKDGLCTLDVLCPFQSLPNGCVKKEVEYPSKAKTVNVAMLQTWLDRVSNLPVYVEVDGCRVEATGLLVTANEIVILNDTSGEYV